MAELIPIEEHELLVFWVQLFVILVFARALGWMMRKIGLPGVIGELGAGLLLGPSVFGTVWPEGFNWFLNEGHEEVQSAALLGIAWVGVALLLVVTGFETDLGLIRKLGRPAALVTTGSLIVPLIGGLAVGYALPGDLFLAEGAERVNFALFVALALSVSSLAVVAKILSELGLMRRDFGQITVAAGMANDVVGWLMLGVFTGLATSGEIGVVQILKTIVPILVFVAVAMTLGQRLVDRALRQMRRVEAGVSGALTVALVSMLGFGVVTQKLGVEAVLGAFVAGVVLHRSRFQHDRTLEQIEGLTLGFFAPIFFATAGLRVDLRELGNATAITWTLVIIVVAIVAKFIGAYGGARMAGRSHRGALALGAGLNARGALEIVIATVGSAVGVFNTVAFTAIVLVPVVTSVFASIGLRLVVRGWDGSEAEQARLSREAALDKNIVVNTSRLLMPSDGDPASIAAAQILHFAWPEEAAATVITAGESPDSADIEPLLNTLYGREIEHRKVKTTEEGIADIIVKESALGFGVIGLGADELDRDDIVISTRVDDILSVSPIPVVLVRRNRTLGARRLPAAFARAVVPIGGTPASRAASEIAFNISANLGTEVHLTHVITRTDANALLQGILNRAGNQRSPEEVGQGLLDQSATMALGLGVETKQTLRSGEPADEILALVAELEADLVVMGANLRRPDGRPFLGHTVERILRECDATVALVLMPFDL
jgi:Kef-type K+ transport system membrane component KefB/nucleotide-binding universal stress UspA family protein